MRFGRHYGHLTRFCFRYKRTCLACLWVRWLYYWVVGRSSTLK